MALCLPASLSLVTKYVIVESLTPEQKMFRLLVILGLLTAALVVRTPVTYLRSYLAAIACNRTVFDIRLDLFRHVQRLSLAFHNRRRTGNISARLINDLNDAQGLLSEGVIDVAMDTVFLCGIAAFLFVRDWRLALVSLFTMPLYGVVFYHVNPRLRSVATEVQKEMEEMSGEVNEKLAAIQVVKSFTREDTEEESFFERQMRYCTGFACGPR